MSQENVETLYRALDAINRRDLETLLTLHDPDVEIIPRILRVEGGRPYRGHQGLRNWWKDLHDVFPEFSAEIAEVKDLGNVTLSRLSLRGEGLESGAAMEQTAWQVVKFRDNKAVWWAIFLSEAEALEGARLID